MASIVKRKKGYSVVYNYINDEGEKKQKWEKAENHAEALKRKAEIETQIYNGIFIPKSNLTIEMFLEDFVSLYGESKWGLTTYSSSLSLINHYINPIIGNTNISDIDTRFADMYIKKLKTTRAVNSTYRKAKSQYVTNATINSIVKLLKCSFKQAVRWKIISLNPFENIIQPKYIPKKRDIWNADIIKYALDNCRNSKLYLAMNLSFACSLRIGEICGLTWDNIHISDGEIINNDAHIYVEKELKRVSDEALKKLDKKDVIKISPTEKPLSTTRLVLKNPKTKSSMRKIWLPKTVAYMLREWKKSQDKLKEFLGSEYYEYNFVIAHDNGKPVDSKNMNKYFDKLKNDLNLPDVVFHPLRHSSTTYKLKLNNGDLKATQGDTGHAATDMITRVYAHILDEDRKLNAQKFEQAFYSNPDLRNIDRENYIEVSSIIEKICESPKLLNEIAKILKNM